MNVQDAVRKILAHRKRILRNGSIIAATAITSPFIKGHMDSGGGAMLNQESVQKTFILAAILAPTVGAHLLRGHEREYQKEELGLYNAINEVRTTPVIRDLVSQNRFIAVDNKGGLVGKKYKPRIGFIPIGRRRINSPILGAHDY